MPHARQTIREAVVTLVTGLSTTGSTVYDSRVYPVATLPALSVYATEEEVQADLGVLAAGAVGKQMRRLVLVVEARARAASGVEDTLDTICAEVEAALAADPTLGVGCKWCELAETEIELDAEAEQPTALARLRFVVDYRVDGAAPTTIVN